MKVLDIRKSIMTWYVDYIVDQVTTQPGRLSPSDIIKKLRLHCLNGGGKDPGYAKARKALEIAIYQGKIEVRHVNRLFSFLGREFCYPI